MPKDLLRKLVVSEPIDLEDVERLLRNRTPEGVLLDYKRGRFLEDDGGASSPGRPTKAAAKLRKWVAGFANADGGVLIVGAADGTKVADPADLARMIEPPDAWTITGAAAPGGGDLGSWATNALQPLAGQAHPRVATVPAPGAPDGDQVLLVGVERAPDYVWCAESGQPILYLRLHDSTIHVPEYLVRDLVLGRRQRPVLRAGGGGAVHGFDNGTVTTSWRITLTNESLAWADDVAMMLIGYLIPQHIEHDAVVVRDYVKVIPLGERRAIETVRLGARRIGSGETLPALGVQHATFNLQVPTWSGSCAWHAALLIRVRNDVPRWAQVVLRFQDNQLVASSVELMASGARPLIMCGNLYEEADALDGDE